MAPYRLQRILARVKRSGTRPRETVVMSGKFCVSKMKRMKTVELPIIQDIDFYSKNNSKTIDFKGWHGGN